MPHVLLPKYFIDIVSNVLCILFPCLKIAVKIEDQPFDFNDSQSLSYSSERLANLFRAL